MPGLPPSVSRSCRSRRRIRWKARRSAAPPNIAAARRSTTEPRCTYHYTLLGLPLSATYNTTGQASPLADAIKGVRATLLLTPTFSLGHPSARFVVTQLTASTYFDLEKLGLAHDPGRSVLALRALGGLAAGASQFSLPPDQRFYAGGSGTIRGYRYQSVGPPFPDGNPIGGTAINAGTIEYRQRIGAALGFATFVDAGNVSQNLDPLKGELKVGVGAGVRYYTALGPLRVDFAIPAAAAVRAAVSRILTTRLRSISDWGRRSDGCFAPCQNCDCGSGAALLGLLVLLVGTVLIVPNTEGGRAYIVRKLSEVTDGKVRLVGIHGYISRRVGSGSTGAARLARVVALGRSHLPALVARCLAGRHVNVDSLHVALLHVERAPVPDKEKKPSSSRRPFLRPTSGILPSSTLELGKALAGDPTSLTVKGNAHLRSLQDADAHIAAQRTGGNGDYEVTAHFDPRSMNATLKLQEPANGPLENLVKVPGLGALNVLVELQGPRNAEDLRLVGGCGPAAGSGERPH